ncbi:MAG: TIGR02996 domain-containing protein [Planctomycetaceae bacterium]|nr:TIGR02996 domain-containing protein [Planctomycetaceae bacterium]
MKADEFEKAIRDDPDNLDLRLIAADWYEEQGSARADFIRVQLALKSLPEQHDWRGDFEMQQSMLLEENRDQWDAPVLELLRGRLQLSELDPEEGPLRSWTYRGGFIEELKLDAEFLLDHWDVLSELGPIRVLELIRVTGEQLQRIATDPRFANLNGFRMRGCSLRDSDVVPFLRGLDLERLLILDLADNEVSISAVEFLEACSLPQITQLILTGNYIEDSRLAALHEQFGDVVQNKEGQPMWMHLSEDGPLDSGHLGESYDDASLYDNGRREREDEESSVDRFNGQTEFEELPWERPEAYGGFESETALTAEDRTRFDEEERSPNVDPDFHDDHEEARRLDEMYEGHDPWDDGLV